MSKLRRNSARLGNFELEEDDEEEEDFIRHIKYKEFATIDWFEDYLQYKKSKRFREDEEQYHLEAIYDSSWINKFKLMFKYILRAQSSWSLVLVIGKLVNIIQQ